MARIGRKGSFWLRAFHFFFMGLFMGVVISELVIIASAGSTQSDGGLQTMYQIPDILDIVVGPAGSGIIITGLLLSWLTPWGFFKHKWVVYKIAGTVVYLLISFTLVHPLVGKLAALAEVEGLRALQNPEYISAWNWVIILLTVCTLLLISAVFVSVFKPWRRREAAEATS
jgi:hypothetical protein